MDDKPNSRDNLHWLPTRWQLADSFTKELRDGDNALTGTLKRAACSLDVSALEPYEKWPRRLLVIGYFLSGRILGV